MQVNTNTHIIKRQVLDIHTDVRENAYQVQDRVKELYYEKMLPMIEEACNAYNTGGEIIRLDQFTLDLGEVDLKNMDRQITTMLKEKIYEELSKVVHEAEHQSGSKVKVERVPVDASDLELVQHFLTTGTLPWWKKEITPAALEEVFTKQITTKVEAIRSFLYQHRKYAAVMQRITSQFSEGVTRQLEQQLLSGNYTTYAVTKTSLQTIVKKLVAQEVIAPGVERVFMQMLLQKVVEIPQEIVQEQVMLNVLVQEVQQLGGMSRSEAIHAIAKVVKLLPKKALKQITPSLQETIKNWAAAATTSLPTKVRAKEKAATDDPQTTTEQETTTSSLKDKIAEKRQEAEKKAASEVKEAQNEQEEQKASLEKEATTAEESQATDTTTSVEHPEQTAQEAAKEHLEIRKRLQSEFKLKSVDETYVKNAGLVLLWNYIPFYFKHLELVKDGAFVSEAAQHRAVHLLQYIATGNTAAPEYDLSLNKLLCGLDVEDPIEEGIQMTAAEKEEADNMMQTVIDHWGGLGKASPIALQQSFLQREGLLSKDQESWLLRVEDSTIDILLDKLPWSFSIVSLQWMKHPIYVEW